MRRTPASTAASITLRCWATRWPTSEPETSSRVSTSARPWTSAAGSSYAATRTRTPSSARSCARLASRTRATSEPAGRARRSSSRTRRPRWPVAPVTAMVMLPPRGWCDGRTRWPAATFPLWHGRLRAAGACVAMLTCHPLRRRRTRCEHPPPDRAARPRRPLDRADALVQPRRGPPRAHAPAPAPGHEGAAHPGRPRPAVPDGAHRAGGHDRALRRDPADGPRDLLDVAPLAARARAPARAGARHEGSDLLQVRGCEPGRLAQAQHRGRAGVLQRARGNDEAHDRDGRGPV